jgi:hypothetical protein
LHKTNEGFFMKRHEVLKELDRKETAHGKPVTFSIKFRTKGSGELIYIPKGISTGLRMNMSANRMRGVQPVDEFFNRLGHPTPFSIDRIVEFNGKKVYM